MRSMTFNEWCERHDNMTAREHGIASSAWVRQDENYAPLVEAVQEIVDNYDDGEGLDRQVNKLEAALAAVKETI